MLSQVNLFAWLLISSIFASSVVFQNGGVSNYGNHYSTVLFFSLAFLFGAVYIFYAAKTLVQLGRQFKNLARYLNVLGFLMLLVFITTFPRRFGPIFSDIHDNISIALFAYEFLLAIWLVFKLPKIDTIVYMLIMASGSLIGLLSSLHVIHLMFIGQMVGSFGFALLLVLILPKVISGELKSGYRA